MDEFSFWAPMTRARKGHTNSRLAELSIVGEPMEHSRSDYTLEGLKFEPALDTVDDVSCWRLYSSDFSGWFVSDFCRRQFLCTHKTFTKGRPIFSRSTENGSAFP